MKWFILKLSGIKNLVKNKIELNKSNNPYHADEVGDDYDIYPN